MKGLFFNVPAQGHINPTLPVVTELIKRGEKIVYYNMMEWCTLIEATGAFFHSYPPAPALALLKKPPPGGGFAGSATNTLRATEQLLPAALEALRDEKPDYVIFDAMAGWGRLAAVALQLPTIASITTLVFGGSGAMPPLNLPALVEIIGDLSRFFPAYWQTSRHLKRTFGIQTDGLTGALMNTGDLNIVYTSAQFQPNADQFDSSYKFVGPAIAQRADTVEFPFEALTRHPIIYISLGTINNDNLLFYRQCFEAFGNHPGLFILSAGRKTKIADLGTIPDNFIVRNFVPQLELLPHIDLFINHAGMNSVNEGLYFGVPQIAIPQKAEQAANAVQIEKQGVGLALGTNFPFGRVTVAELRSAVEKMLPGGILDPQFKAAASKHCLAFQEVGGYMRAADEIIKFTR